MTARLLWWIGSPLQGLLSARGSTQTYRNRELVRLTRVLYGHALREREGETGESADRRGRAFVKIATFACPSPGSMSWHLSEENMIRLRWAARKQTRAGFAAFDGVCAFWSAPSPSAATEGEG